MPRIQSLIVMGFAVFFGLIAVILVNNMVTPKNSATTGQHQMTKLVVAKVPLPFGTPVTEQQLKLVDWPMDTMPPNAFHNIADVVSGDQNRVVLRSIEINEPLLASKLSGKGGRLSVSGLIDKDKRAATIRVNDVVGVGGFLLPGDRVDVLVTRDTNGERDKPVTDVLLQNVRVVGVDQDINQDSTKPSVVRSVTLEVTQVQSQKLVLAQQAGSLSLALRNVSNDKQEAVRTIGINDLRDIAAPPLPKERPKVVPRPPENVVQVVRGTTPSTYKVGP